MPVAEQTVAWNILQAGVNDLQDRVLEYWRKAIIISTYNFPFEKLIIFAAMS